MRNEYDQDIKNTYKKNKSFLKRLWSGIINLIILLVAGYLGLVVIMGILWIALPPLSELSDSDRKIIDTIYKGYVTAWGIGSIISFFAAFSGFSVLNKLKNLKK